MTRELHVVLVEPEIHWNTGNTGRSCLAAGAQLHLVEPLGFSLDAKQVQRAGLDYWPRVEPRLWPSWTEFERALPSLGEPSGMLMSAHADPADLSRSWSWKRRIQSLAAEPYDSLFVSKLARAQFRMHSAWRGDACSVDPVSMALEDKTGAKKSLACNLVQSDESSVWIRMRRLEIDVALTREILRLRRERSVGAAPPLACGDWSFEEELRDDGGFRVAFRGTLPWTMSQQMEDPWRTLPLEHVEPPPAR